MGYGRVVRHQTRHRQVQISRDIHIFYYNGPTPKIQKHMDALLCQHGVLNSLSYLPGIAQVLINEWY
jgi:hypothetical protein|uniref:Uncharacterized protein n=1 Tax=Zea mays TaxID=4577 RepID=C0PB91_MAIZE|nr:unknown [Zea mays]